MKIPAVFLDRDGVLNANRPAGVFSLDHLQVLPEAKMGMFLLRIATPYRIVMVTNQSGIERGTGTWGQVDQVNDELIRLVGGGFDGVYVCPHGPERGCFCRKPMPGMLLSAARDLDIDLLSSWVIGDRATDLQAGKYVGCSTIGIGGEPELGKYADYLCPTLLQASWLVVKKALRGQAW